MAEPAPGAHPPSRARAWAGWGWAPLWGRLGLRARVTAMFGLGALLLSVSMGGLSYLTVRHFLVGERENASVRQAYLNASYVRSALGSGKVPVENVFNSLETGGSDSVLYVKGKPFSSSLSTRQSAIPTDLRHLVLSGTAGTEVAARHGSAQMVVGVPIPAVGAAYFEIFDLSDLDHTLRVLALALAAAGAVTTVLGAAVGRTASGRSLRPLADVSRVAVAIAGGQLDTRLPASDDPDLVDLTTSFNRMVDQLAVRIEREARFTSDVSHELRSPLTTLAASVDVLEAHRSELPPRARRALSLLADELRRFQRMVDDLLEISRSDTGRGELVRQEVVVGELVPRAVAAAARHLPPDDPVPTVELVGDVAGLHLSVDKRRFERVLDNLLLNASTYGGGATRVVAEEGPAHDGDPPTLRVAVEDRGPGVPETERGRVFERFYRGQASGRRGTGTGTGLGLALVTEHVALHGGRVWAEEAPGGGARFVVELPVEPEADPW